MNASAKKDTGGESYVLDDLGNTPGHLMRRCQQIAVSVFLDECRSYDLTPLQFAVLAALLKGGPEDQVRLGGSLALDRTTISVVVKTVSASARPTLPMRCALRAKMASLCWSCLHLNDLTPACGGLSFKTASGSPPQRRAAFLVVSVGHFPKQADESLALRRRQRGYHSVLSGFGRWPPSVGLVYI